MLKYKNMVLLLIIAIIVIQATIILSHFIAYQTIIQVFKLNHPVFFPTVKIVFFIMSFTFVIASLLNFKFNNQFVQTFYTLAASWLGLFYILVGAVIYQIIAFFAKNHIPTNNLLWLGKILLIIGVLFSIYGLINARQIKITNLTVKLPNLPSSWQGKKAVWASDWHLGPIYKENFVAKVVNLINQQKPDLIFLGGDLYDGTATDLEQISAPLKNLNATWGTYFITGNHEQFGDENIYLDVVKKLNIKILKDAVENIQGVNLIGVDFKQASQRQQFSTILTNLNLPARVPNILLKHEPKDVDISEQAGINLQLSGHTHRGQIFPFSLITSLYYHGFDHGFKKLKNLQVFTSDGVGTWGPPTRVGSKSEILVITFE